MSSVRSTQSNSPENRAMRSEQEAQKRIEEANERAEQAIKEIVSHHEARKDQYVRSSEQEMARNSEALNRQSNEGYDHLGKMRAQQNRELKSAKDQADQELAGITETSKDQIQKTQIDGQKKLSNIQSTAVTQLESEKAAAREALGRVKSEQSEMIETHEHQKGEALRGLASNSQADYEQKKDLYLEARDVSDQRFGNELSRVDTTHRKAIAAENKKTSEDLKKLKQENSQKLGAYSSRAQDPFYQLVHINAQVRETPEAFVLSAQIPEHEQRGVQVSVQGDRISVSGFRSTKDAVELEGGRKQTTSAYQSFTESFPIHWPVDAREVSKSIDGDQVTFTFPKKLTYSAAPKKHVVNDVRERVERPVFPENLPHVGKKTELPT